MKNIFTKHLKSAAVLLLTSVAVFNYSHAHDSNHHQHHSQHNLASIVNSNIMQVNDPEVQALWNRVLTEGGVVNVEADIEARSKFLTLQATIEESLTSALEQEKILGVVGVIHTRYPSTALRIEGDIAPGLLSTEVMNHQKTVDIMKKRVDVLKRYLATRGRLVSAYPKYADSDQVVGLDVYESLQKKHPNLVNHHLGDYSEKYSGASYLIQETNGNYYFFSIMATHTDSATEQNEMGVWFGALNQQKVKERLEIMNQYLLNQNIDLKAELLKSQQFIRSQFNAEQE